MHENPDRQISAAHNYWRVVDKEIRNLQLLLGVVPDGFIGPLTRAAAAGRGQPVSNQIILTALTNLEKKIMDTLEGVTAKFDEFISKNNEYIAQIKRNVAAEIKAAVEADDAAEQPGIAALGEKIQAAIDNTPAPEQPTPSNL